MATLVTILASTIEIVIDYRRPNLCLWTDRGVVFQALFEAFSPWDVAFDNIDIIEQGKNSDKGFRFRLPNRKASFFFGPLNCKFTLENADWGAAHGTVEIINAGLSTLMNVAKVEKATQHVSLSLHMQPTTGTFIDILMPFVPPQLKTLSASRLLTMASVVKWDGRSVYIDGSGSLANAVFVKLDRDFPSGMTFEEIAIQISEDEFMLLHIMDVEEDRS